MKTFLVFILCSFIFIISACLSNGKDFFMIIGISSILAFPVYLSRPLFKKAIKQIKQNRILEALANEEENSLDEIRKKNQEKKYKNYNYSHEKPKQQKEIEQQDNSLKTKEYRKNHQNEFISQLKMNFYDEFEEEPNFEKQKHCIFAENEEDFGFENDYHADEKEHQGEREYFLLNNEWCFFDFDDNTKKYTLTNCKNKIFYNDCYIDTISKKTKKILNFFKQNPTRTIFFEADLKNQEKILKTGSQIACINCEYTYFSDNKKCPNCGYLTKDTLEE